jgi:hypothetical protein
MTTRDKIKMLESRLTGLANDSRYWDLRRTFGDSSREVLAHLQGCAEHQGVQS